MNKSNPQKTFISIVGLNDEVSDDKDGAILTALSASVYKRYFDEVILIWTQSPKSDKNFLKIAEDLKKKITDRKICKVVTPLELKLNNVSDHNEVYPKLLELLNSVKGKREFTACISSGTPAMQVCWILMAESGDFEMKLIRSNEPRFGLPPVTEIKLDTGLPRITKAQTEIKILKKKLLDEIIVNTGDKTIQLGERKIELSAMHFAYYYYFLERANQDKKYLGISGFQVPDEFVDNVLKLLRKFFPGNDTLTFDIEKSGISIENFRSHISKIKKTIEKQTGDKDIAKYYIIEKSGKRGMSSYGINLPPEKIKIMK